MIAPEKVNAVWVANLEHQQQRNHLNTKLPTIHVVSQKEVVLRRQLPEPIKDVCEVEKLPMDVADHCERGLQAEKVGLCF